MQHINSAVKAVYRFYKTAFEFATQKKKKFNHDQTQGLVVTVIFLVENLELLYLVKRSIENEIK